MVNKYNHFLNPNSRPFLFFLKDLEIKHLFLRNKCPVTNCDITNDRNRINESDIIVFHMGEPFNGLPKWRFASQRWVFFYYESPVHSSINSEYNSLFNLSSTYRLDSNATSMYFADNPFYWDFNKNFDENQNFLANKTKFSAIIVSNCNDNSKRLEYIKDLKKYIPVTIYGKCGEPCPRKKPDSNIDICKLNVAKNYKFYFSFENSICKDYITEKFFNILHYNIVPVVLGGGDYSLYIPKSGFINVLDYSSPKDLADYLIYLSNNETAYNSFFKWKKHVIFNGPQNMHICELCVILNMDVYNGIEFSVIRNLSNFWSTDLDCSLPRKSSDGEFYYF
jgi:alpha-1,3-fucosyltransferase